MNPNPDHPHSGQVGEGNFQTEVLNSPLPVLVAFQTPWSRPCHVLNAALDEVAALCAGRVKVVRVNADDNPDLSVWYDIHSIPTLLYFAQGTLRATVVGTASKEAILARMQAVFPGVAFPPTQPPTNPGS